MGYHAEIAMEEEMFGRCLDCDTTPCVCDEEDDECIDCGGFRCGGCGLCPDCDGCSCDEDEDFEED